MTDVLHDVRLALRQWARRPLLPATVVVTLTARLGAALAVFAVAWAVVWRPRDVPDPTRLVWIESVSGTGGLLASLLYGVAPGDPVTLGVVILATLALAAVAAWLPARSAAAVDPAEALRT